MVKNKEDFIFDASTKIRKMIEENFKDLMNGLICFDAIESLISLELEDSMNR